MANGNKAKVYYYKATGRGNQLRLVLAAGNIEFEDVYSVGFPPTEKQRESWRAIGGNTTTNIPMVVMPNGKVYTQSSAAIRAVARTTSNLMPTSQDDLYMTDKLLADAEDLRSNAYKAFVPWGASEESANKFAEKEMPNHLINLERQFNEYAPDSPYFLHSSSVTLADVVVYDAVTSFASNLVHEDILEQHAPNLKKWVKQVEKDPGIASYLSSEAYNEIMKFSPQLLGK
mmetsp:Transcript_8848/g.12591  ORF Transcript_8848/g.12591 Transcript_8848/m.12591 type:complete len:230 (-) Transcript_8848:76-765(-)